MDLNLSGHAKASIKWKFSVNENSDFLELSMFLCVEISQRKSKISFLVSRISLIFLTFHYQPLEARALLVHLRVTFTNFLQQIDRFSSILHFFLGFLFAATRKTFSPFARKIQNEKLFSNRDSRDEFSARENLPSPIHFNHYSQTENSLKEIHRQTVV